MKQIELNKTHDSLGAKMVEFAGYRMPVSYAGVKEEHICVRKGVGVFDVSHMGEFIVSGPKALALIQKVTTNDASVLEIGKVQYTCMPNGRGGVIDDLLVYRLEEEQYCLVVNASNIDKDWDWIVSHNDMGADLKNISSNMSLFAVQGPKAVELIQSLTDSDVASMKYYTCMYIALSDIPQVLISSTGYTGAGGFEIYVPNSQAQLVWDAIIEAGVVHDLQPIGLAARDTLRMEMGFCLYGNDIDDSTSPIEAGLGWITKFTKDFVDREVLEKHKAEGTGRRLVGFVMEERGIPRQGYPIHDLDGNEIGKVTSGTMSPSLGIGIGMGYVSDAYKKVDTEIAIYIRDKGVKAKIVRPPFIKKD